MAEPEEFLGARGRQEESAINLSILRRDLAHTKGQVRWVEGRNMLSDPLPLLKRCLHAF